jgi:5-methyltetrahydrofolate--homocysteine methyltransferase
MEQNKSNLSNLSLNAEQIKDVYTNLRELFEERIAILDGAMGTVIQSYKLEEEDYRGDVYTTHKILLKNNNDVLNVTKPHIIREIHKAYLDAGADIIETNTFNSTSISLADFEMSHLAYLFNYEAARLARLETDKVGRYLIFLV